MSDLDDRKTVSSLSPSPDHKGEPFRITARASILTGNILKSLDELGYFDWKAVSTLIQNTLDEISK